MRIVSATDLWSRRLDAAHVDLATALRATSALLTREAERLEKGIAPATHVLRADMRELEVYAAKYDLARAAWEAVETLAAQEASP